MIVRRWIWLTPPWGLLISGGREVVGSGKCDKLIRPGFQNFELTVCLLLRDVAAGIAILEEAGGLVTTANPPKDPDTADIESVRLGSRLYLAIR